MLESQGGEGKESGETEKQKEDLSHSDSVGRGLCLWTTLLLLLDSRFCQGETYLILSPICTMPSKVKMLGRSV